jgi:hypothetical protein
MRKIEDMDKLENIQKSEMSAKIDVSLDVDIIRNVEGIHKGFKFVPILPFFPRKCAGVVQTEASEMEAEQRALKSVGGDFILNKKVERSFSGILLVFWIERVKVTGLAVKMKN